MQNLSQQFYSNINDIKYVFKNSKGYLMAESLMSDIEYSLKATLTRDIPRYEICDVLELIVDPFLAVKLSYECDSQEYIVHRFRRLINDDNFNQFYHILQTGLATNLIDEFDFNLSNNCYKQKIFDLVSTLDENLFTSFLNKLDGEMQNYFCSKKPEIIKKIKNGRNLIGRNKYRHTVYLLLTNTLGNYKYNDRHIGVIKSLVKYYPKQVLNNFEQIYSSGLILFLVEHCEIEIAKQAYELLNNNQKETVNLDGFAFFNNDFDFNLLSSYQLQSNIEYCYDGLVLIEAISKLEKTKIIKLFEDNVSIDKEKAEKILLNVFSIGEVIKICEVNQKFALKVMFTITNEQILRQFSCYQWFWNVFTCHYYINLEELCDVLSRLDREILLLHINILSSKTFGYVFHYFYQIDVEFGFKIFELHTNRQIGIILHYRDLLHNFVERYGLDYIISLGGDDVTERRYLLEQLPLNYALYMCNKLNIKMDSPELHYMHRGRSKALLKRMTVEAKE